MKLVLLDAATLGDGLDFGVLDRFGEVVRYPMTRPDEVGVRIADADIILINKIKITEAVLEAAKQLKLICIFATGYDNVDLAACRAAGVAVCNVKGYSTHSVAQLTVLMALTLTGVYTLWRNSRSLTQNRRYFYNIIWLYLLMLHLVIGYMMPFRYI